MNHSSGTDAPPGQAADSHGDGSALPGRSRVATPLGLGLVIIAVIVALIAWTVVLGRTDARHETEVDADNLSKTMAAALGGIVRQVDLGVQVVLDEVARQQRAGRWDEAETLATMARQEARIPGFGGFRLFGPDGRLRYAVSNVLDRSADISGRDDFRRLRETPDQGLMVTPPVFGATSRQWLIGIGRRITNPDGSFGGAVYGAIPTRVLEKVFAAPNLQKRGVAVLFHTGFLMAARVPETVGKANPIGTSIIDPQLRDIIASGVDAAEYDYTSPRDGVKRIASVRRIPGLPYYVMVGLSEGDYLHQWHRNLVLLLAFGSIMIGVVVAGMVVLHRRMSDLRRATSALAKSERQFRTLLDNIPQRVFLKDLDSTFLACNAALAADLGIRAADIAGRTDFDFCPPELARKYRDDDAEVMVSRAIKDVEEKYVDSGEERIVQTVKVPVENERGDVVGVLGIFWDITERAQIEREREQYHRFFKLSIDPMCIADPYGCFKKVNPALVQLLGYGEAELMAKPFLEFIVPEDRQRTADEMKLQVTLRPSLHFENRFTCKDGRVVLLSWTAYFDKGDGITYATARDITDSRRAEDALRERSEMLMQSNADLEQFAYVASHDLQSPLRNMVSYAQLLEHRYKGRLDADADDFIDFIVDNGRRMTVLIADLLKYSRITDQSRPPHPVAAGEAAARALANLGPEVALAGAEVAVGDLPVVTADESHLVSLFQNLLSNGLKYRAPDRKPMISVTAEPAAPDLWRFAVADNGIGIEPQYHDKVFEIFQRLDPASETEGTGIGLTVCRRIVQRFGGAIWMESEPGTGTTILFTLRGATAPA